MLFYHFDLLDNFIKNDMITNLKQENENIKQITNLYHNKKMNLLSITTNMISMADGLNKANLDSFYETVSLLKNSFESLEAVQELTKKLEELLTETISLHDKSLENNWNEIKANLVEYNKQRDELANKMLAFEELNTSILNSAIFLSLMISSRKKNKKLPSQVPEIEIEKQEVTKPDIPLGSHDNNTLVITEKEQKAYLPYYDSHVKEIFEASNNRYQTMQDVIEDLYVLPLERFKNSSLSRFKEAFCLIRNKENGSIAKALDLGLELMFKHNLNPIVISACRNLDELDIYLDCLEQDQLQDFPCFTIKFEVMPQIAKNERNAFLY